MQDRTEHRPDVSGGGEAVTLDFRVIWGFFRRYLWPIAASGAVFLLLGLAYLVLTPSQYTARLDVLIDSRRMELFREDALFQEAGLNSSVVESQMQVLGSQKVAADVVRKLRLTEDPEFNGSLRGPIPRAISAVRGAVTSLLGTGGGAPSDPEARVVMQVQDATGIKRVGLSYVIQLSYTALDRQKAARIANAIADAYIDDQLEARYRAAEQASTWLQTRIDELREKASAADRAVQTFKAENGIIRTGTDKLLSEAQTDELNTQLLTARNEVAQARARLARIEAVNAADVPNGGVSDVLQSEVVNRLRQTYHETARREREAAARYGETNAATTSLRGQLQDIQRAIGSELNRIEDIYRSDLAIAEGRERTLTESVNRQLLQSADTMQSQVKLRELESTANSFRTLYDTFLQRYTQTVQQQSFPIGEARVITPAVPPERKSAPKGLVILPVSLALGLLLGIGGAVVREFSTNVVRTARQLEAITEAECFGILPVVSRRAKRTIRALKLAFSKDGHDAGKRLITVADDRLSAVLDQPFSRAAETLRAVKVAAAGNPGPKAQVIGVVSSVVGEGKTLVSANLSRLIAQTSSRTLLIDCDLRNPGLTQALAPDAKAGLESVLTGDKGFADVVYFDRLTELHVLPAVVDNPIPHTEELLASDTMIKLLEACRSRYDHIVLDLPPILPVVDVRAAAHLPDAFVLVVEWNRTQAAAVRDAVTGSNLIHRKLLGTVLNKVDVKTLNSFEPVTQTYYRGQAT